MIARTSLLSFNSLLSTLALALVASVASVALGGCADPEDDDVDSTEDEVRGGTVTLDHPEIGKFQRFVGNSVSTCTATLVRPDVVITAAHCYPGDEDGDVSARDWRFTITTPNNQQHVYKVDRSQTLLRASDFEGGGESWRARDIALLHLAQRVPANVARPAGLASGSPFPGEKAALYGYGCTDRATRAGTGTKRKLVFRWGALQTLGFTSTQNLCPGDSGGPLFDLGRTAVVGTNSGGPANFDYFGNVPRARTEIEAVIGRWSR